MELAIPKLKFAEPRRNLPSWKGFATREDRFTISFARAYAENLQRIHPKSTKTQIALAREIRVNGYGIADLVAVAWQPNLPLLNSTDGTANEKNVIVRAFECKIKDWRSALAQAIRYRYFANQAIVVLPMPVAVSALSYLETFRKTGIGLWGFDQASCTIRPYNIPRPTNAKSPQYISKIVKDIHKATRTVPPTL